MSAFRLAPAGLGLAREAALAPRRASALRRGESRAAVLPRVVVHSPASRRASPSSSSASRSARVVAASANAASAASADDLPSQKYFSGLEGAALDADRKTFPTMAEVLSKIPKHCFVKDTWRSMRYAFISTALTVGCGVLAYLYLPLTLAFLPAWIAYAFVAGTCATGCTDV